MKPIPPKDYIDAVPFPDTVALRPIGVVRSPYKERHGTPRQAVVTAGTLGDEAQDATIELFEDVVPARALSGLEGFDYVWVVSWLHLNHHWNPTVVPPRGPKVRRGVLATRAPHRPNPLGLSALRLLRVEGHRLHVQGLDLLDGTPILDLKPYVPYADAFPDARSGWLDDLKGPLDEPDRRDRSPSRHRPEPAPGPFPPRDPTASRTSRRAPRAADRERPEGGSRSGSKGGARDAPRAAPGAAPRAADPKALPGGAQARREGSAATGVRA